MILHLANYRSASVIAVRYPTHVVPCNRKLAYSAFISSPEEYYELQKFEDLGEFYIVSYEVLMGESRGS